MNNYLHELKHVEQELAELQSHLDQSFGVLDGLAKVQTQFEDLAQTYQELKQNMDEVKAVKGDITTVKESFQASLYEIEVKFKNELHVVNHKLKKTGLDEQQVEKQEMMEHQLRLTTSLVQNLERKVRGVELKVGMLTNWLLVNALTTVLAIILVLLNSKII